MKTYLIILSMLTVVSCGKVTKNVHHIHEIEPEILVTEAPRLEQRWVNLRDQSILDLSQVRVNNLQPADDVLYCSGQVGNGGLVNGVPTQQVYFTGSSFEGTIQFGHLNYVNATDARCRAFSKERYEYKMVGEFLQIRNITWCAEHLCPQDGIEFYKQDN